MIGLLKQSDDNDDDLYSIIKNMNLEFDTCKKYKRNAKLIVVFPLAEMFNETIAMDLKHWSDDTQYSVSYVVRSYYILLHHIRYHILSKVILQKISIHWVDTLAVQIHWLSKGNSG